MITLHLTRNSETDGVYLKLPSTPAEIGEAFAELDTISADRSAIKITEVISNVYNLSGYLKNVDVENSEELEKVSTLAKKFQTMDRDTCHLFEGALDANSVNGIDDILRLSESLEDYTLMPDAASASALGKYLVEHGVAAFPEKVRPYLNYQIIGTEFYTNHGGAFCRAGCVVRKDALPEQFRQVEQKQKSVMLLNLRVSRARQAPITSTLALPASDEVMDRTKQRLGIEEFAEAKIMAVDYIFPYFATMVPQDCISVEGANLLAYEIERMAHSEGEMLKYLAALQAERPDTFFAALNIAVDLHDYETVPGSDGEEYGRAVLKRMGADQEMLDALDGYMDFAAFGENRMREDGVKLTEFGQIRRLSTPFDAPAMGGMEMQ